MRKLPGHEAPAPSCPSHEQNAAMKDEHSRIRALKQRWDDEDAARNREAERAKQIFLEEEANQTFEPIQDYFTRLSEVLSAAGVSVEIDTAWQHIGDRKLSRMAKVTLKKPLQRLSLDFTIQGVTIFYRDKVYRFASGIEGLIGAITSDVEQFLTQQHKT
jgi:hypothetical protein